MSYTSLQQALAWAEKARRDAAGGRVENYLLNVVHDLGKIIRHAGQEAVPFERITAPTELLEVPPATMPHEFTHLDSEVDGSRQTLILVQHEGRNVGKIAVAWHSNDIAELAGLFVNAGCRGRGLGRALLQKALIISQQQKCKGVNLCVRRKNHNAITLYIRMGFRIAAFLPADDEFVMVRFIAPPAAPPPIL